jgi:predicted nucleic acid-binding protein
MELVMDASVLFTGIIGTGVTKDIIFSKAVTLFSPEYLFEEFEEHKSRVEALSGLTSKELGELFEKLKKAIRIVPKEEFEKFLKEANSLSPDRDDTEYFALSLSKSKTPIWSNDSRLKKQSSIKVFSTSELAAHLKSAGLTF